MEFTSPSPTGISSPTNPKSYRSLRRTKRPKLHHEWLNQGVDAKPFLYPYYIPESALDTEVNRGFELWPSGCSKSCRGEMIEKTASAEWGPPEKATARANLEPAVTPQNEALIRTYHPAFAEAPMVYALTELSGKVIWMVLVVEGTRVSHTHAAGREIHISPELYYSPDPLQHLIPRPIRIPRLIYPRRMLTDLDISTLRSFYPDSVGIRIYITGFAVVLFRNTAAIKNAWKAGYPDDIGGLDVVYETVTTEATAVTVQSSRDISDKPDSFHSRGCLGLRIKGQSGTEAVTAVTHAFVKLPGKWWMYSKLAYWLFRAKEKLLGCHGPKAGGGNLPLGKSVYIAGEAEKAGTVTTCYDDPSPTLPYPAGYRHDLCLSTGPNLPHISSPPGVGMVTEWAEYEDALDGMPVFVTRFDAWINKSHHEHGRTSTDVTKRASVEGTEYLWLDQAVTASLLWRTDEDWRDAQGCSGSVLCLGRPTDPNIKAVVFQNYQTPINKHEIRGSKRGDRAWLMKAGLLLPQEVRESQILSSKSPQEQRTDKPELSC
ncbi:hypothetical protein FQN52_008764 [Onygenales sp. PD_12]|nr:hypothetical protein FQN52_008764 [Onygenales sp. PD_12]